MIRKRILFISFLLTILTGDLIYRWFFPGLGRQEAEVNNG